MDTPQATKDVKKKVDQLLDKMDKVLDQQKELVKQQEVILDQVAVEEKEEVVAVTKEVEKAEKVNDLQKNLIVHAKHHKLLFPLVVTAGVVLVWRGLTGIFDA